MTKVYPNTNSGSGSPPATLCYDGNSAAAQVLTVWKKSLLLNCDGFTVFDAKGNLVFRVDNYVAGIKAEIVLMDAAGKSLLTIRRKKLSLADNWLVFEGETAANPVFTVRKPVNLLNPKSLAHVSSCNPSRHINTATANTATDSPSKSKFKSSTNNSNTIVYEVEGSYAQRSCAIYDAKKRRVAEIKRKEAVGGVAFGLDVFRLILLKPSEIDSVVAMALVILLDQMFGSSARRLIC